MAAVHTSRGLKLTSPRHRATLPPLLAGGWVLGLCLGGQGAWAQAPQTERIVDRVVAVVDGTVLTQSQLELEARIALIQSAGADAARAKLEPSALRASLEFAIAQRLANEEADRLQAFSVDEADVQAALRAFIARLGGDAAFQAFLKDQDADTAQIEAVLTRGVRFERLLDSKVRLRSQVTEAQIRHAYEAQPELHGQKYEVARAALRERLSREHFTQAVKQELALARRGADVRLVAEWAREPNAEGP